jgi:hypothetical protein
MAASLVDWMADQWADVLVVLKVEPSAEKKVARTAARTVANLACLMAGHWVGLLDVK